MIARDVVLYGLLLTITSCTPPKHDSSSSSTQPDGMPTTQAQWLRTADHDAGWYADHRAERRARLKACDAHKDTPTPDCSNANSAAIGVGDY